MKNKGYLLVMGLIMISLIGSLLISTSCSKEKTTAGTPGETSTGMIADMIIINGKIITVDKDFSIAQAVAVKGDRIIAVGTNSKIKAMAATSTKIIDLKGKTLMPGINDTHIHSTLFGSEKAPQTIDITYPKMKSITDIVKAVEEKVKTTKPGEWIIGASLYLNNLDEIKKDRSRLPTRQELDAVSPNNPVCITVGYFSFFPKVNWLNTRALEIVGINKDMPNPPDERIVKDPSTGELTGMFIGTFAGDKLESMIKDAMPDYNLEYKKQAILSAQRELNALGITSITDGALGPGTRGYYQGIWDDESVTAYKELRDEGKLTMRTNIMMVYTPYNTCDVDLMKEGLSSLNMINGQGNEWLRIAGSKFFADGNPMKKTSWNYNPWPDGTYGTLNSRGNTDEEKIKSFTEIIAYAHNLGIQVGIHAIGDRAAEVTADAFIKAEKENPKGLRHYVVHSTSYPLEKVNDFIDYQIGIASQTGMMLDLMQTMGSGLMTVMGSGGGFAKPRYESSTLKELVLKGVHVSLSSDAPCAGPDWKLGVAGALSSELTIEQIIRMYTIEGAWLEHNEMIKGSIETGKLADFCILDKDILSLSSNEITGMRNLMTVVGGKIVYDAGEL